MPATLTRPPQDRMPRPHPAPDTIRHPVTAVAPNQHPQGSVLCGPPGPSAPTARAHPVLSLFTGLPQGPPSKSAFNEHSEKGVIAPSQTILTKAAGQRTPYMLRVNKICNMFSRRRRAQSHGSSSEPPSAHRWEPTALMPGQLTINSQPSFLVAHTKLYSTFKHPLEFGGPCSSLLSTTPPMEFLGARALGPGGPCHRLDMGGSKLQGTTAVHCCHWTISPGLPPLPRPPALS